MKTTTFFVLSLLLVVCLHSFALNYTIAFTGSGTSTIVGDVIVQNLTQGTSVTVPAGNVLNLSDQATAIEQLYATDETIYVYPNSVEGKSTVSFFAKQAGITQINAFRVDGKKIAGITANLQTGSNTFELSLPKGIFAIQVKGNEYSYTAKMINQTGAQSKPGIVYVGTEKLASTHPQKSKNSTLGVTSMTYIAGDQLLYKAVSGPYSTIVTDVPTGSKTTNFDFVACTDTDGNNYTTVTIGTQTWMAENLKTTKYRNNIAIDNVTDNTAWVGLSTGAWCDYENTTANGIKYGHLYNWYAVADSRSIAPVGWHVATDAEWTTLTDYVSVHLGTSLNAAKALAAASDWTTYSTTGAIGSNLTMNNSTGFSALPGGQLSYDYCKFIELGNFGLWWSATYNGASSAFGKYMNNSYGVVGRYYNYFDVTGGFSVRCVRDNLPTLSTTGASGIANTYATSGGNVIDEGGVVIARGICWSTTTTPTIALSTKTIENGTTGVFLSRLTNLTANTKYYVRSYATYISGTAYGAEISFTTLAAPVVITDIDGNIYTEVVIGTQIWMVENLKTTHYRDGSLIENVTNGTAWAGLSTGAWCDYENTVANGTKYGHLYNWYAISDIRNIAPLGWHLPTDAEWTILTTYLGGANVAGGKLKEVGTGNWPSPNIGATNETGFSALPGGLHDYDGTFRSVGNFGYWWSSTEDIATLVWYRFMGYSYSDAGRISGYKNYGLSVRCLRDL